MNKNHRLIFACWLLAVVCLLLVAPVAAQDAQRLIVRTHAPGLNLHDAPGVETNVLGTIPRLTDLQVLAISEDGYWYQVTYNGQTGWISKSFTWTIAAPEPVVPQPSTSSGPLPPQPSVTPQIEVNATADFIWGRVLLDQYCDGNWKLAVYALTDKAYVQPYADARRDVRINSDCTFSTFTHPWYLIAVHVVPVAYFHPDIIEDTSCPPLTDPAVVVAFACHYP